MVSHTAALYCRKQSMWGCKIQVYVLVKYLVHKITRQMKTRSFKGKCKRQRRKPVSVSSCDLHSCEAEQRDMRWAACNVSVSQCLERNSNGGRANSPEKKRLTKKCLYLAKPYPRHTRIRSFFVTYKKKSISLSQICINATASCHHGIR